jgi:hypothetical protein
MVGLATTNTQLYLNQQGFKPLSVAKNKSKINQNKANKMNIGLYEAKVLIGGLIVFIGLLMIRYYPNQNKDDEKRN